MDWILEVLCILFYLLYQALDFTLFVCVKKTHLNGRHLLPLRKIESIVSWNRHVTFAFSQSLGICGWSNKGCIWPFNPIKNFIMKYFFCDNLFTFERIKNIHATEGRQEGRGWVRIFTSQWPLSVLIWVRTAP